jgi:hypothetical protein
MATTVSTSDPSDIGIIIHPTIDHNGAFARIYYEWDRAQLAKVARVYDCSAINLYQFYRNFEDIGGGTRKIKYLVLKGHGSPLSQSLSHCFDMTPAHLSKPVREAYFAPDCVAIIDGCSTAPMARQLHDESSWTLFAPETSSSQLDFFLYDCPDHGLEALSLRRIYSDRPPCMHINEALKERLAFFMKRALDGDAEAQYVVALCMEYGYGTSIDEPAALTWFHRAASNGLAMAQAALADMYFKGQGVPQDIPKALKLYEMAARQGDEQAIQFLEDYKPVDPDPEVPYGLFSYDAAYDPLAQPLKSEIIQSAGMALIYAAINGDLKALSRISSKKTFSMIKPEDLIRAFEEADSAFQKALLEIIPPEKFAEMFVRAAQKRCLPCIKMMIATDRWRGLTLKEIEIGLYFAYTEGGIEGFDLIYQNAIPILSQEDIIPFFNRCWNLFRNSSRSSYYLDLVSRSGRFQTIPTLILESSLLSTLFDNQSWLLHILQKTGRIAEISDAVLQKAIGAAANGNFDCLPILFTLVKERGLHIEIAVLEQALIVAGHYLNAASYPECFSQLMDFICQTGRFNEISIDALRTVAENSFDQCRQILFVQMRESGRWKEIPTKMLREFFIMASKTPECLSTLLTIIHDAKRFEEISSECLGQAIAQAGQGEGESLKLLFQEILAAGRLDRIFLFYLGPALSLETVQTILIPELEKAGRLNDLPMGAWVTAFEQSHQGPSELLISSIGDRFKRLPDMTLNRAIQRICDAKQLQAFLAALQKYGRLHAINAEGWRAALNLCVRRMPEAVEPLVHAINESGLFKKIGESEIRQAMTTKGRMKIELRAELTPVD